MNRFSLNGSTLNGGGASTFVLALAAVVCSASGEAKAERVLSVQATLSCSTTLSSQATYTGKAVVNIQGQALLFPAPTHTHASNVNVQGSASLIVYVLRDIPAFAGIVSGVDIVAVVASTQGSGSIIGSTSLVPTATRVQAAYSAIPAYGEVSLSVAPTVIRNSAVDVQANGFVRAEPHINNAVDAYSTVVGDSNLLTVGLCSRLTTVTIHGQTVLSAVGTLIQPGYSNSLGSTQVTLAVPNVMATLLANIATSSTVDSVAFIEKQAQSNLESTASVFIEAKQQHAGNTDLVGSAYLTNITKVNSPLFAEISGDTSLFVTPTRIVSGEVFADANSNISAVVNLLSLGNVAFVGSGNVLAKADAINTHSVTADADLLGTVDIDSDSVLLVVAYVDVVGLVDASAVSENLNKRRVSIEAALLTEASIQAGTKIQHAATVGLQAQATVSCESEALNQRRLLIESTLVTEALVEPVALRSLKGTVTLVASGAFTGEADQVIRLGEASLAGTSTVVSITKVNSPMYSNLSGFGTLVSYAERYLTSDVLFNATSNMYVDTITNPEAYDPEERTFVRAHEVTTFIRPFVETEFKRAA